ncbi:Reverse transcriptase (RNA-dependent DNA polymerase) [Popillia japonica]|uniref:Reverse transcriptase (RNA-dependent DNA polymerase) n=1 Tax=Popillia japonica TaxID=7064 RepID=A0AAW1NMK9_POPJA
MQFFDQLRRQLGNGLTYSKIDLKDAYLQFEVEEASRKYLIISTHKGYFQYNRLPFGIVNAPALFCRYIENLLNGIDNVAVYFDDIAITGPTNKKHLDNLKEVFKRLRSMGLRVQLNKCTFMKPTIEYLGHEFSKDGIRPTLKVPNENQEKTEITTPQNLEPEINDFSIVSVPGTTTPQTETTQLRRSTRTKNQEKTEITTPQNLEPEINDFSIVSVPGTTTLQTETTQLRRSTRIRTIPRRYPE